MDSSRYYFDIYNKFKLCWFFTYIRLYLSVHTICKAMTLTQNLNAINVRSI